MSLAPKKHLDQLHAHAARSIEASVDEYGARLGALVQLDLDIACWERALTARPECAQLTAARRELGFATYAASSGLYLQAYGGLRLFLELGFASVYFSANELHRRKWVADRKDFSWSAALDANEGILAGHFVREFSPEAADEAQAYASQAAAVYRHCSQFIHGKFAVTETLPDHLDYSSAVLGDWVTHAHNAAKCLLFLVYVRYGQELPVASQNPLSSSLEANFAHLRSVRSLLGLATEAVVK